MALSNDELVQRLRAQLVRCAGFESDDLATDRERAIDYYHMRPNGTEVPGRSTVVSGDVSAMVEANLAAMLEAFSAARIVEFDALGPEDEQQAQLESDAVVHMVMGRANGEWQLAQAIKDTLLLRNGWMKIWCEEQRRAEIEEYRGVAPEALQELLASYEQDGVECKILRYDPQDGYAKLRCVHVAKRFRAEAVPCENIIYPKGYDGADFAALQQIPVIFERHVDLRSDLITMGFPRAAVERIPAYRSDNNTSSAARNPRRDTSATPGVDEASESVEWYEAYVLLDGGDGIVEREKVCFAHEIFLKREPARFVPYATGQAIIAPHRLTGISLWDKLRQTQDINTALTRALLDNVQATSKNRIAYLDGKANPDDIADGRVNGAIRVKASVARVSDAVMPFVVPDTSQGIKDAIQHQRQIRSELGGSALDMQAGELQVSKQVGSLGLDRAFSVAEQLAAHMTSNVAHTLIRSTFLLAHAVLREHYDQPLAFKVNGRWVTQTPADWPVRESLTVKVGMSPGERMRRQAALDKLLQAQIALAERGLDGVLVDVHGFYALLMDWARVSDIPSPERYFLDPQSEASMRAQAEKQAQAQRESDAQRALVAQAVELEKLRTAFEKYRADQEAAIEIWKKKVEARIEYAKLGQEAEIEEARLVTGAATQLIGSRNGKQNNGADQERGDSAPRAAGGAR